MLSKQQAKMFFLGGTGLFSLVFLFLTWDTMQQIPEQTNSGDISEAVVSGRHLWDENNCMGCHTILGEGAYYAPELIIVIGRKGESLVKAILMTPESWSTPEGGGRKMVAYGFSGEEADNLIAFFKWVGNVDLNGFPAKTQKELEAENENE